MKCVIQAKAGPRTPKAAAAVPTTAAAPTAPRTSRSADPPLTPSGYGPHASQDDVAV
jgi:hypothetical protein